MDIDPEHDIELVNLSSDGTMLAWTENVDGYSSIFTKNLMNGQVQEITNLSLKGVIEHLKLSTDGKRIGVIMTTSTSPSDIYIVGVDKNKEDDDKNNNNNSIQKISHSLIGNISQDMLIKPDLIKYKSFDGLEVSAFLYKPKDIIDSKAGSILSIHGGPTRQESPSYRYSGLSVPCK
jgi:dipeptidyl aminopeptidase/acylaminoacyl peptidase